MNTEELTAVKIIMKAILIECQKGNIASVENIAEYAIKHLDQELGYQEKC